FDRLGATDDQLDFPVIYASALNGYAGHTPDVREGDMTPLFEAIAQHCPPPPVDAEGPLQMQISQLDYSSYVGAIGIGRITRGTLKKNSNIAVVDRHGRKRSERVLQVFGFMGLDRVEVDSASAGDIVAITGIERPLISDTLCDPAKPEALPPLTVDEPTISMVFETNTSPFAGKEGKYVTSRQVRDRLQRELLSNVALRVEDTDDAEKFLVSGRGELHLSILMENMRREGYELAVSRPQVITKVIDDVEQEPVEAVTIDIEERHQGAVMEAMGERGGDLTDMSPDGKGRVRLDYKVPSRGLIGFQTVFKTMTSGTGLLHHVFDHYAAVKMASIPARRNGVLISNGDGKAVGFALFNLQERGRMLVGPGEPIYEGMIIGIHSRDNDLTVNPLKAKQLTNIRAAGKDDNVMLTPPERFTLEQALAFINDDELMEVTPASLRLRKRYLKEHERKSASRRAS
ncbi:MAG TPA: EF-Tu/IF-2/RF-3 family GTPase, partial [Gammaproteobacteria bacterium]